MIGLDSTFIIDFLRDKQDAVQAARDAGDNVLAVTPITVFEVFLGVFNAKHHLPEQVQDASAFFERIELLPITSNAAITAARVQADLTKTGKQMEVTDALIACTCLAHGCTRILTRDKSFERVNGLEVVSY